MKESTDCSQMQPCSQEFKAQCAEGRKPAIAGGSLSTEERRATGAVQQAQQ